jgi:hypothetical protein
MVSVDLIGESRIYQKPEAGSQKSESIANLYAEQSLPFLPVQRRIDRQSVPFEFRLARTDVVF